MHTRKAISTISYNSEEWLRDTLCDLYLRQIISNWYYIKHYPEEDEKKEHFHVYMMPNKQVDTMELGKLFIEPVPNSKPLKCLDFHLSDCDNWILYNLHDSVYLASKGESRKFHYTVEDLVYCDDLQLEYDVHHAYYGSDWAKQKQLLQKLNDPNIVPADLIKSGLVPFQQSSQLNAFMYMNVHYGSERAQNDITDRGGRFGHE